MKMSEEKCTFWNLKGGGENRACTHPNSKQMGCWNHKNCYLINQCIFYKPE